jgi:hypothetical protein
MTHTPQVDKSHYAGSAYRNPERWMSYWHQLVLVERTGAHSVLEAGVGSGVLARELHARGLAVETLDIAADLSPDIVGSVLAIPKGDGTYDATLAFEVLEHIPFEDAAKALSELARVSKRYVIVSLPHPGWVFSKIVKLPLLPRFEIFFQVPFFWKEHAFNGEHYWELGKKGYPISRFSAAASAAGLRLVAYEKHADDPAHRFFLFEKA